MSAVTTALLSIGGAVLGVVSFLLGKAYTQSERILELKRKAYEEFLKQCPAPNEAHFKMETNASEMQRHIGILTIYGSAEVLKFAGEYFIYFSQAQETLQGVSEAGHPVFMSLMTKYNRMVWAMRTDAMMWSVFAPVGRAREYNPSWKEN